MNLLDKDKIDTKYHYVRYESISGEVEYRRELKPEGVVSDKVSVHKEIHSGLCLCTRTRR